VARTLIRFFGSFPRGMIVEPRACRRGWMLGWLIAVVVLLCLPPAARAASVSLAWNPNTEPDLAGYKIHMGTSSRKYSQVIDVGHVTSFTVSNLQQGQTYYFAVTAYDIFANQSRFSVEISATIPGPPAGQAGRGPTGAPGSPPAAGADSGEMEALLEPKTEEPGPGRQIAASPSEAVREGLASQGKGQTTVSSSETGGSRRARDPGAQSGSTAAAGGTGPSSGAVSQDEGLVEKLLAALGLRGARDQALQAEGLYQEGQALISQGRFEEAIRRYQEAERLWQGLGATGEVALAAEGLGTANYGAARYLEALDAYGRALQLSRRLENRQQEARVLDDLGMSYESLGHPAMAIERYRAAVEIWRGLGLKEQAAAVLERQGAAQAAAGRYREALTSYQQSLALFRELGQLEKHQELEVIIGKINDQVGRERSGTTTP
jgi:tetratricopeptide (TPR) repeat protein